MRTLPRVLAATLLALLALLAGCRGAGPTSGPTFGPVTGTAPSPTASTTSGPATDPTRGPTSGTPVEAGSSTGTVIVSGLRRSYRLYVPPGTGRDARPLVVFLHGGFGSARQAEQAYDWDDLADRRQVVIAYPDGLGRAWDVGGGCCGVPGRNGTNDVGFVTAMVRQIQAAVPIDARRIYATGISNGGMLAYRLVCDSTLFAAIGPDSATLLGGCPHPAPVSVLHVHGTADTNIRYSGGPGEGVARIDGPAVPDLIARWRATDGCAAPIVTTSGPLTTSIADCPGGRAVELITIDGAGHQWPGAPGRPVTERLLGLDPPSTALDATGTIWRFFAAHPKPA
jgi:polyhydroxybutyrate depolymerase